MKDAFSSVENMCHFKEETLVTQIVGVRVVESVPSSLVLTNSTD